MKFFFADNLDTVDPDFDFESDETKPDRNRQGNDLFAHEVLEQIPYDGILISRSILGGDGFKGRYSQGQRHRMLREGARKLLRFPCVDYEGPPEAFPIMGDCGAFSYSKMDAPPISLEDVFQFYQDGRFTYGVSVDHVIVNKNPLWDRPSRRPRDVTFRAEYTYKSAIRFLDLCRERQALFHPIGVVQSWSPRSAAEYARRLVDVGYDYIGLGGLAGRPTRELLDTIATVRSRVPTHVKVHVFGMTRLDRLEDFHGLGIDSFDSASPMVKAFKDDRHNYFSSHGPHFKAIRIPTPLESGLRKRIQSGSVDHGRVLDMERKCLDAMAAYSREACDVEAVVKTLHAYEDYLSPGRDNRREYREVLTARPWEKCDCSVCRTIGPQVIVFRGLNRNKRRGYHNLHVFYAKLRRICQMESISVPCIRVQQSPKRWIYSFVAEGRDITKFASISRIKRDEDGSLMGYQRPEIQEHISDIRRYIETPDAILPNSIVVAFGKSIDFREEKLVDNRVSVGVLNLRTDRKNKSGWIVDGQQRIAALRESKRDSFPVSIIAFESDNIEQEREQFVLVNSTKPLPKSLVYELLPSLDETVPPRLRKRQKAYRLLERLNLEPDSPFYCRIRTVTSRHMDDANIKDLSVLKMIENSSENGVLFKFGGEGSDALKLLKNYWSAVSSFYPQAWELPPRESRLTHGAGIVSMGFLMDTIAYALLGRWRIPPVQSFLKELKKLGEGIPWTNGTWRFGGDMVLPWNAIQNTSKHVEILTNYLIRKHKHATWP